MSFTTRSRRPTSLMVMPIFTRCASGFSRMYTAPSILRNSTIGRPVNSDSTARAGSVLSCTLPHNLLDHEKGGKQICQPLCNVQIGAEKGNRHVVLVGLTQIAVLASRVAAGS